MEGTRRGRLVMRVETRNTYTHEAITWLLQWPSVQVTVVVLQLIRKNAIAHAILVPRCVSHSHAKEAGLLFDEM